MKKWIRLNGLFITVILGLVGCAPSAEANVVGYLIANQIGTLEQSARSEVPMGSLTGYVVDLHGRPIEGATVIVAQRTGEPHSGMTNAKGHYRIAGIPIGKYVPAAVAPGYGEIALRDRIGIPTAVEVLPNSEQTTPLIELAEYVPNKLPQPLAGAVNLAQTAFYETKAPFPMGATAQAYAFQFEYNGATVDTLRFYLPAAASGQDGLATLPIFFVIYPTHVDLWQTVSTAFAAEGYALVAMSPIAARAVDIDAHANDASVGLTLATSGELTEFVQSKYAVEEGHAVALGGSFSSAILNRLLRDSGDVIAAWITVGGIGNAFTGTADFYAGRVTIPPPYELLIPALGSPRLYPLPFLRYSPAYVAGTLPPTQIIHTAADAIIPITQARELEAALRFAGVPVDVFYYDDVSHYLQIDENLTDAGKQMYYQVLNFLEKHSAIK